MWTFVKASFIPAIPLPIPIVPERVWEQYDGATLEEIRAVSGLDPVVSGPFTLTSWAPGQGWTIERNPYFWYSSGGATARRISRSSRYLASS